ncbi:MAG: histidine triad nucleotide-binding protein [Candidatus Aminicenantes bacterium]|nr:histidine triad nucleotide-binding protein [Candidatus Aminicenantes bacterium]
MDDCLFCKIVAKEIPARVVREDETVLAFEDIRPQAPVHILIIPKEHFASLDDAGEDKEAILGRLLLAAAAVAREKGLARTGYRVVINTGPDSGQEVFHTHVHLLGGRKMRWPPG